MTPEEIAARFQTARSILRDWMWAEARVAVFEGPAYFQVAHIDKKGNWEGESDELSTFEEALVCALGLVVEVLKGNI